VDIAIGTAQKTTDGVHCRTARKIDLEFLFNGFAKRIILQFIEQGFEAPADRKLGWRVRAWARHLWKISHGFGKLFRLYEFLDDQILVRRRLKRSLFKR
jgi:hypothetical protein